MPASAIGIHSRLNRVALPDPVPVYPKAPRPEFPSATGVAPGSPCNTPAIPTLQE
jgi:hypothetical protein